jgi:hypothetical protein
MRDRGGNRRLPGTAPLTFAVVAMLAACGTTPTLPPLGSTTGPSTGPLTAAPTVPPASIPPATNAPSAAPPSTTSGAPACAAADLKASHGLVEGGAGSRVTEVVLVAAATCSVDLFPTLGLRDGAGSAIVGGVAAGSGRIDVSADAAYASEVRIANWCAEEPAFPVTIQIRVAGEEVPVTGGSFPEEGSMPPCNGDGAPVLEAGAWTPTE